MAEARKRRRRWLAFAAGGALLAGGAYVALGPAAPGIIDSAADGQRVWRLGHIELEGVTGSWLGDLHAELITIADADGVWLEARDVALDWRPQDLMFGGVRIDAASANTIAILRRPMLLESRPPSGASFDVRIGALHVDEITMQREHELARFTADLELALVDKQLRGLDAQVRRLDSDADRFIALYRPDDDYALNLDIEGAPGGVIAASLGVPDQHVRGAAEGAGDARTGSARYNATIGDAQLLSGDARWDPDRWAIDAQARLDLLPWLGGLARRIGDNAALNASGARVGRFEARAQTPFFAVDLSGALDEEHVLDGPAQFVATSNRLSDIARESPFELGAARMEGEFRRARGVSAIRGTLDVRAIEAFGRQAHFTGPLEAALSLDSFRLDAELHAAPNAPALFADAQLRTELVYDRSPRRAFTTCVRRSRARLDQQRRRRILRRLARAPIAGGDAGSDGCSHRTLARVHRLDR